MESPEAIPCRPARGRAWQLIVLGTLALAAWQASTYAERQRIPTTYRNMAATGIFHPHIRNFLYYFGEFPVASPRSDEFVYSEEGARASSSGARGRRSSTCSPLPCARCPCSFSRRTERHTRRSTPRGGGDRALRGDRISKRTHPPLERRMDANAVSTWSPATCATAATRSRGVVSLPERAGL